MTDWLEQYSAALTVRDAREQAHKPYIDAYTRLADRTASAALTAATNPPPTSSPSSSALPIRTSTPTQPASADTLTSLRQDLAANQKARSLLTAQITTLTARVATLERESAQSTHTLTRLTQQKSTLERALRDHKDELREKAKLVQGAQDEMVSLGLALNMAEQKAEKLEAENQELVSRWMARMENEVENENRRSGWGG